MSSVTAGSRTSVHTHRSVLHDLGERLDRLQARTAAPVTARRPWMQVWLDTHPTYQPLVFTVESEAGELLASALLTVTTPLRGLTRVVAMGHGPSDVVQTSAVDDDAAEVLAALVADHLRSCGRPWLLDLRHVHPEDPTVPRLASRLPHARTLPGDVSPLLLTRGEKSIDAFISGHHRRGLAQIRNRLRREGLDVDLRHLTARDEVVKALPAVERVHRLRDLERGRASAVDDPAAGTFFRTVVEAYARRGEVELTTLHIDGALAAYVLCFLDPDCDRVRMWNCRFDPAFSRYSPGRVAIHASVAHAVAGGTGGYDFMRGDEQYKFSYANTEEQMIDLRAASNAVLWAGDRLFVAARELLRRLVRRGGRTADVTERALHLVTRLQRAVRR